MFRHRRTAGVRSLADAIRALLVLATLAVLALGHVEAGITLGLVAVTTVIVRFAGARAWMDLTFVALAGTDAALNAAGAFTTFNRSDALGHFVLPAAVAPILWAALERGGVRVEPGRWWLAALVAATATIALGAAWELVEWASDAAFGTHLSLGYTDTLRDLATDMAGAVGGLILLVRPAAPPGSATEYPGLPALGRRRVPEVTR